MKTIKLPKLQMGALGQVWPQYPQLQMADGHAKPVQAGSLPQGRVVDYSPKQMG